MPSLKSSGHEAELGGFPLRNLLGCWLTDGFLHDCLLSGRFLSFCCRCCFSHGDILPLVSESARTNKTWAISSNLLTTKLEYGCEISGNANLCCVIVAFFMFLNGLILFSQGSIEVADLNLTRRATANQHPTSNAVGEFRARRTYRGAQPAHLHVPRSGGFPAQTRLQIEHG